MKIKHLTLLSTFMLIALVSNGQYWNQKQNDTIYYESPVIIGSNMGEDAMLSISSKWNSVNGGGYGLIVNHSTDASMLKFKSRSRIGYSSNWSSSSQATSYAGALYLNRDNASSIMSRSAGGLFILEFDDYAPYDNYGTTHYLGGSYNTIRGNINVYPENAVIAAVIGKDQINEELTYGGYFEGKGFFSDNVGVGVKEPKAKLQIADGDVYISDIDKGIIMKSPDGNCWRGVLDNSGNLTFSQCNCPDVVLPTETVNQQYELKKIEVKVFPNPADDEINVSINGEEGSYTYSLVDINGITVKKGTIDHDDIIDVVDVNSGIYILKVSGSGNQLIASKKVAIQ